MTQKTVTRLIMLSIIVFMLQACNNELDSLDDNSESEQGEINIDNDGKYYQTYYLPSSYSDQTTAFQNAVNRLGEGDVLVLKSGAHKILRGIKICSNIKRTIRGEAGSYVQSTENTISLFEFKDDSRRVTFDNVYVYGKGVSEHNKGVMVRGMYHKFKNCTFTNNGSAGMFFHFASNIIVDNCNIFSNAQLGISQWNSANNEIKNCHIYSNGGEGITIDGNSHNSKIHHNIINNNLKLGGGVGGIGIDDANNVQIYNNQIYNNRMPNNSTAFHGIKVQNNLCGGSYNLSIYNNTIYGHTGAAFGLRYNSQPVTFGRTDGNTTYGNVLGRVSYDPDIAPCTWGDEGKPRNYHWCSN